MSYSLKIPYTPYYPPSHSPTQYKDKFYPMIRTVLQYSSKFSGFTFNSIVDSGAEGCIFPAEIGEKIGIDARDCIPASSVGIGGSEVIYYKKVKVWTAIEGQAWPHSDQNMRKNY